jgi:hypothetical protein
VEHELLEHFHLGYDSRLFVQELEQLVEVDSWALGLFSVLLLMKKYVKLHISDYLGYVEVEEVLFSEQVVLTILFFGVVETS